MLTLFFLPSGMRALFGFRTMGRLDRWDVLGCSSGLRLVLSDPESFGLLGTPELLWTQSSGWSRGLFRTGTKCNPETSIASGQKRHSLVETGVGFHW